MYTFAESGERDKALLVGDAHLTLGQRAERVAQDYLERLGYALVARNWRCRFGELDLVMRDGEVVVFVEVRSRRGGTENAFMSVDGRKLRKLQMAITTYLSAMAWDDVQVRLDVVAVRFDASGEHGHLSHARDVLTW